MSEREEQQWDRLPAEPGEHVDLNTSTEEELCSLPGIGPFLAARIIEYRSTVHPFEEPIEIAAVPGISERMYRRIADRLVVSGVDAEEQEVPESEPAEVEQEAGPMPHSELEEAEPGEALAPETEELQTEELPAPEPDFAVSEPDEWSEPEKEVEVAVPVAEPMLEEVPEPEIPEPLEPPAARPRLRMPRWRRAEAPTPDVGGPPGPDEEAPEPYGPPEPEWEAPEPEEAPARLRQAAPERAPTPLPEPPVVRVVSQAGASFWQLLIVGVLSAVAGAFLALLILVLVNRTLDFRGGMDRAIEREASRVDGELADLGEDLDGLREQLGVVERLARRLDDTEAGVQRLNGQLETIGADVRRLNEELGTARAEMRTLNGRVDGIETSMNGLRSRLGEMEEDMTGLRAELDAVSEGVRVLSGVVDEVREATQRFDAFLQGLRELLK